MNADITNMKYNIVRIWTDKSWLRYLQKICCSPQSQKLHITFIFPIIVVI